MMKHMQSSDTYTNKRISRLANSEFHIMANTNNHPDVNNFTCFGKFVILKTLF